MRTQLHYGHYETTYWYQIEIDNGDRLICKREKKKRMAFDYARRYARNHKRALVKVTRVRTRILGIVETLTYKPGLIKPIIGLEREQMHVDRMKVTVVQ